MRNLTNWVKGQLIERAFDFCPSSSYSKKTGLSVLDFCCGKGGDLFKWIKSQKGGGQIFITCCRVCAHTGECLLIFVRTIFYFSDPTNTITYAAYPCLSSYFCLLLPTLAYCCLLTAVSRYVGVDIATDSLKHFVNERLLMDSISDAQRQKVSHLISADMGKDSLTASTLETHTWVTGGGGGGGSKVTSKWEER